MLGLYEEGVDSVIKTARKICKYQGIKFKLESMVLCPACGRKTMKLNLTDNNAVCIRCGKKYKTIDELERIEEENWHDNHSEIESIMQEKGSAQK